MRQEFVSFLVTDGGCTRNPQAFSEWLKQPAIDGIPPAVERDKVKKYYQLAVQAMDTRLDEVSNRDLHPENRQLATGGFIA